MQRGAPLELGQRVVPGVGLRAPHLALDAVLPGEPAYVGVTHIVPERRRLLGGGVLGPDALRPAEVRDARLGRDAGAGQDHDAPGVPQPPRDPYELLVAAHA